MTEAQTILAEIELDYIQFTSWDDQKKKEKLPLTDQADIRAMIWNLFQSDKYLPKMSGKIYADIMDELFERVRKTEAPVKPLPKVVKTKKAKVKQEPPTPSNRTLVFQATEKKILNGVAHYKCHYCKVFVEKPKMTLDHKKPKSKGGGNEISNLLPSCRKCNVSKADTDYDDYIEHLKQHHNWKP